MHSEHQDNKHLYSDVDYVDTWQGMEDCIKQGLTKSIGVSNFTRSQLQRIIEVATILPVTNQVSCKCGWVYFSY